MKDAFNYFVAIWIFIGVTMIWIGYHGCGGELPNPCEANPGRCVDMMLQVAEDICQQVDPDAGVAECIQDIIEANK